MRIQDQIHDIIELKKKHHLVEDDATYNRQVEWYNFAIRQGLVILEYRNDKLVGFIEFIRLNAIPKRQNEFYTMVSTFTEGSVLLVGNCIAETRDAFIRLKNAAIRKNPDVLYYVWHRKKSDLIKSYKNKRREYALAS